MFSKAVPWFPAGRPPIILKPLNSAVMLGRMENNPGMEELKLKGGASDEIKTIDLSRTKREVSIFMVIPVSITENITVSPLSAQSRLYRKDPYPVSLVLVTL